MRQDRFDAAVGKSGGFTFIELTVVLLIIGVTFAIVLPKTGSFSFWKREGTLRQLVDTVTFLHHQALSDQAYYRLEFDLIEQTYRIGVVRTEELTTSAPIAVAPDAANLTLELAAHIHPSLGSSYTVIPPPSFPSLWEPQILPEELQLRDVRTRAGVATSAESRRVYIHFSPRGLSDFAVIHLVTPTKDVVTLLINPFTGNVDVYRGDEDFEWSFAGEKNEA